MKKTEAVRVRLSKNEYAFVKALSYHLDANISAILKMGVNMLYDSMCDGVICSSDIPYNPDDCRYGENI